MTREEAIKWIDDRMCFGRYTPSAQNPFIEDEYYLAGRMAIEALEKQIPKNGYDDEQKLCVCPNCKSLLEGYEYFCWKCGQRIDWKEEES